MFENPAIVDRFLDYWRKSGHQRIGYLYGRYEYHDGVPLGIRATISAIYEPPQVESLGFFIIDLYVYTFNAFLRRRLRQN